VRRVRDEFNQQRTQNPFVPPPDKSAAIRAEAAALLGVDPAEVQLRGEKHKQKPSTNPFATKMPSTRPSRSREAVGAGQREKAVIKRWTDRLMEPSEIRAWRAAGLGVFDDAIADECRKAKLSPQDLAIRVDGVTAASRMRGGEPVWSVIARMRELGLLTG
jgi:cobalamin biosynthesis protein CbiG